MQRDDLVYVGHMADSAEKAAGKVSGLTRAEFDRDENLRLALTHLLQHYNHFQVQTIDSFLSRILKVKPTPFETGLKETYRWYLRHRPYPAPDYTFEDSLLARVQSPV